MDEGSVEESMLARRVMVAPCEDNRNSKQDNKTPKYLVKQLACRHYSTKK